jgi:hypothetical protein
MRDSSGPLARAHRPPLQGVHFGIFDSRQRDPENLVCFYLKVDQSLQDALLPLEHRKLPLEPLDLAILGVLTGLWSGALAL